MVRLAIWTTAKVLVSRRDPSCKAHYYLIWGKFEHLFSVAMRNFLFVGRTDRGMLKKRSRLIPGNKRIINRVHDAIFPQIFQLGVGCVIVRQVKLMCEPREHF